MRFSKQLSKADLAVYIRQRSDRLAKSLGTAMEQLDVADEHIRSNIHVSESDTRLKISFRGRICQGEWS